MGSIKRGVPQGGFRKRDTPREVKQAASNGGSPEGVPRRGVSQAGSTEGVPTRRFFKWCPKGGNSKVGVQKGGP